MGQSIVQNGLKGLDDLQVDFRIALTQATEKGRHQQWRKARWEAERDGSAGYGRATRQVQLGLFDVAQQECDALEQHRGLRGQVGAACVALEQGDTKLLFQQADLTTQRRLRDPEDLGSPAEVFLRSQNLKVAELP